MKIELRAIALTTKPKAQKHVVDTTKENVQMVLLANTNTSVMSVENTAMERTFVIKESKSI